MSENIEKWLSVKDYAKKIKRTPGMVYLMIRLGQIPKENIKTEKIVFTKKKKFIKDCG